MRFAIIVFPGSNCDRDCYHVLANLLRQDVRYVFHKEKRLPVVDCVILPGGFSYGDYLRAGAVARFSNIMDDVLRFANAGGLVFGICNGFQIMLEAGLLPGAMRPNVNGRFICRDVFLRVETSNTVLTKRCSRGQVLKMPIAHAEGCYYAPPEVLADLKRNGLILFRYVDSKGRVSERANPNGSLENIAGIMNKSGNCFGMMPHPERACEVILGSEAGMTLFQALASSVKVRT